MTFHAIHKETNKIVGIYQLLKDAEWIGRERETFIALKSDISNWDELKQDEEIPMSFVDSNNRRKHFRINHPTAKSFSSNESEEHKKIKEDILFAIINNQLIFKTENKIFRPSELPIKDVYPEYHDDFTNKRSDLLIEFKEEHETFGKGIIIEIQLSYQNKGDTIKRTHDKTLGGYSICWVFKEDYTKYILENKEINVIPYYKAQEETINYLEEKQRERVNSLMSGINNKIEKLQLNYHLVENKIQQLNENIKINNEILSVRLKNNFIQEKYTEIKELSQKLILDKIKEDSEAYFKNIIPSINKEIKNLFDTNVKSIKDETKNLKDNINYKLKEFLEEEIKNKSNLELEKIKKSLDEKLRKYLFTEWQKITNNFQLYQRQLETFFRKDYDKLNYWRNILSEKLEKKHYEGNYEKSNLESTLKRINIILKNYEKELGISYLKEIKIEKENEKQNIFS